MPKKVLYQTRSVEQLSLLEDNTAPTPPPAEPQAFYTVPACNRSANQYYFLVYSDRFCSFVGYADVEYPTADQIRSQF